jgi:branched-chain amino acid transport system permease protein
LGALIQRVVIQPIHNVAALSIVATFGLSLILQESLRITFGPTPRRILPPIQGTVHLFGIDYEVYRIFGRNRRARRVLHVPASHATWNLDAGSTP